MYFLDYTHIFISCYNNRNDRMPQVPSLLLMYVLDSCSAAQYSIVLEAKWCTQQLTQAYFIYQLHLRGKKKKKKGHPSSPAAVPPHISHMTNKPSQPHISVSIHKLGRYSGIS